VAGRLVGVDAPSSDVIVPGQFSELLDRSGDFFLLHCMSPLMAQSGHHDPVQQSPLSGVKRTSADLNQRRASSLNGVSDHKKRLRPRNAFVPAKSLILLLINSRLAPFFDDSFGVYWRISVLATDKPSGLSIDTLVALWLTGSLVSSRRHVPKWELCSKGRSHHGGETVRFAPCAVVPYTEVTAKEENVKCQNNRCARRLSVW
jgi:hypothetical protein